jgi:hypothetical protein
MQAFVNRNDLVNEDEDHPVPIIASYGNGMVIAITAHGPDCTVLFIQDDLGLVRDDRTAMRQYLRSNWRDSYMPVINAEANRRINLAFPQYKQMNYNATYNGYQTQYGTDSTTWPPGAPQDFLAEYNRGWKYVNDVRDASNAWTAMPVDPTADGIWPPVINPIT